MTQSTRTPKWWWLAISLCLLPTQAFAQKTTLTEVAYYEEPVAALAAPSTALPYDSEFSTAPSPYLAECRTEGMYFDPEPPPAVDPRCPLAGSSYDGANCYVATPSVGTTAFVYYNNLYTSPLRTKCPVGYYDGANCFAYGYTSDVVQAFTSGLNWYYYSSTTSCQRGTKIGTWSLSKALCLVGTAPTGSEGAFIYGTGFYYKALVADRPCPKGSWDGANCFIATPPYGATGFVWGGNLYHTPYSGPPVELWGNQLRYRGVFATIYIHGRNASGTGPVPGFGYTAWANRPKGPQPIWLSWDSTQRFNYSKATVKENLDLVCVGPTMPCHVVCHSAGCQMITMQLAENPGRWNIASVTAIAGSQGGSEIASIAASLPWYIRAIAAYLDVLLPIDADLTVSAARNMYDHNQTSGAPVVTGSLAWTPLTHAESCPWWMWVIASPYCGGIELWNATVTSINNFYASLFLGSGHDGVLAYHSTAGFRNATPSSNTCNPSGQGYWTNYDSIMRRGYCYPGLAGAFHSDGWKLLDNFGTIPP